MVYLLFALLVPIGLCAVHAHTVLRSNLEPSTAGPDSVLSHSTVPGVRPTVQRRRWRTVWRRDHQTVHFLMGFMEDPGGQLNSWANSGVFDMGPMTLYDGGLCDPDMIRSFIASGRYFPHHTFAALIQKS